MVLIGILFVSGCQSMKKSGYTLPDVDASLVDIRKVSTVVIGTPARASESGHEIISKFYSRFDEPDFNPEKAKERLYTRIFIGGDRRPYDVLVSVVIEQKGPEGYEEIGTDPQLSTEVGEKIKKRLNESRDSRNVIDDFRAY